MKTLVAYDSVYGNTGQIAAAIAAAIEDNLDAPEEVQTVKVADFRPEHLKGLALLVVGAPTHRFSPTPATTAMLKSIPKGALKGIRVAAFDTRLTQEFIDNISVLAFFVKFFGYAAKPIGDRLVKKGGELVIAPEGYYVVDSEGPLVEGELERAANWAKQIVAAG